MVHPNAKKKKSGMVTVIENLVTGEIKTIVAKNVKPQKTKKTFTLPKLKGKRPSTRRLKRLRRN